MIISRAPLRMSFVGGGSDLPSFYREHGGAVVSTTVDKYVYVTINKKFDDSIRISYSKTEEVDTVNEIQHPIVREAMRLLKIPGGLEITSVADIPAKGTGLGSSSTFAVGLLHALYAQMGKFVSAETLARQACELEIDVLKEPIGKQDQYAAAYGGLSFIQFNADDSVFVHPIICARETLDRFQRNTICFYTGITRSASAILKAQDEAVRGSRSKQDVLRQMVRLTYDFKHELEHNNLDTVGEILHANWVLKKSLTAGVSSPAIDEWYAKACQAGATGGKLLGAGSGGFLMFYAPEEAHPAIAQALGDLRRVDFKFEPRGSAIIFVH
ncbi:GHMP family kinase ATP-binding protein [Hyalangium versicolor]|uniref:GHMP family kinase ATP-binding protein n=1 Tax=Hyalangium versicolor TaxID=2861190 RepID=UPI001CCC40F1|nr:sugar kinase [Hyalangium versicolor]